MRSLAWARRAAHRHVRWQLDLQYRCAGQLMDWLYARSPVARAAFTEFDSRYRQGDPERPEDARGDWGNRDDGATRY